MSTICHFYSLKIFALFISRNCQLFQNYSLCLKVPIILEIIPAYFAHPYIARPLLRLDKILFKWISANGTGSFVQFTLFYMSSHQWVTYILTNYSYQGQQKLLKFGDQAKLKGTNFLLQRSNSYEESKNLRRALGLHFCFLSLKWKATCGWEWHPEQLRINDSHFNQFSTTNSTSEGYI